MKQLFGTARNIRHTIDSESIETFIEMVLIASGPGLRIKNSVVVRSESLSMHRFEMTIDQAEQVRDDITKWITEAKIEKSRLAVRIESKETNDE